MARIDCIPSTVRIRRTFVGDENLQWLRAFCDTHVGERDPLTLEPNACGHIGLGLIDLLDWIGSDVAPAVEAASGAGLQFSGAQLFRMAPQDAAMPWHRDSEYFGGLDVVCFWLALEEVGRLNGCLMMAPDESIELDAGDAVIFTGDIVHRTLPSQGVDRTRRSIVVHFLRP